MVTLKNSQVLPILMTLNQNLVGVKLPGALSLRVTKLIKLLSGQWEDVDKVRQNILKEHSLLDEKGEPKVIEENGSSRYDIDPEKQEKFDTEIKALFEETVEVPDNTILLGSQIESIEIEPAVLLVLEPVIA